MIKTRGTVALAIGLFLAPSWQAQENWRNDCIRRCVTVMTSLVRFRMGS